MRGLKPELMLKLVRRDVELVKKEAVFFLEFNGDEVNVRILPEGRLKILAVVGPVESIENHATNDKKISQYFPNEAILLEIGMRRGRPYNECQNTKREEGELAYFSYRRKWFQMSKMQFLKAAPLIFILLQEYTNNITIKWKATYIRGIRHWWDSRRNKFFISMVSRLRKKAIRFYISRKDENFLKFIYWAELNLNQDLKNHLIGLSRIIDKRLKIYRENGYRKKFIELKGAKQIKGMIERRHLSPYLLEEMLEQYIPYGKKNLLINEITELIIGYNVSKSSERQLIQSVVIPNIKKIEVRVVRGLEEMKSYIVFELFTDNCNNSSSNDDCPF